MALTIVSRKEWRAWPPKAMTKRAPSELSGVAVHWFGSPAPTPRARPPEVGRPEAGAAASRRRHSRVSVEDEPPPWQIGFILWRLADDADPKKRPKHLPKRIPESAWEAAARKRS